MRRLGLLLGTIGCLEIFGEKMQGCYGNSAGNANAHRNDRVRSHDERFYTPRASALSSRSQASASSRFYTPRADLATARSNMSSSTSDNSFRTSRSSFSSPSHYLNNLNRSNNRPYRVDVLRRPTTALDSEMDLEAASASIRSSQYNGPTSANSQDIFSLARHARVSEVEELLIRGVPITSRDENGNGILSIACQNGSRRTAKLALRFGADINEQNCSGNTPLHYCCLYQKNH